MSRAVIVGGSECSPVSVWYPLMRLLEAGFEVHALGVEGLEALSPPEPVGRYDIVVYADCREAYGSVEGRLTLYSRGGGEPVTVDAERGVVYARDPWALYLAMRELLRLASRRGLLADTPSSPTPGEVRSLARRLRLDRF